MLIKFANYWVLTIRNINWPQQLLYYHRKICLLLTALKLARSANSDGLINWLRQPGQIRNIFKIFVSNIHPLIKLCSTRTDPAAETNSIGLQADPDASVGAGAQLSWSHLLDNFIVTRQILPTYRDPAIWTVSS
jgi:hypothetical protein